ncbi:phage head closure protein [Paenibacillus larvae]|nr:phage head closure protein [Paenibacillus larvae]MDT2305712.1 phage head closure protein [Paenibacillus larvae]
MTFQKHGETTNENGFKTDGWVDVQTVWACIKTPKGKEFMKPLLHRTKIQHGLSSGIEKGFTPDMRIK